MTDSVFERLQAVRARIDIALGKYARCDERVELLAVSKTFGVGAVRDAVAAGQRAFGENYIQEAVDKITALSDLRTQLQWHCIGPIQSNKTRLVAAHFDWVHTLDRIKIAQRLNEQRPPGTFPLQVCIQVNVDGGPTKSGVQPEQALALAQAVQRLPQLRLRGLMCIPEPTPDFETARAVFARAKTLLDQLNQVGLQLDTLSMGMSADLEAAIAAGSTLVRVGSAIFGARPARTE